MTDHLHGVDPDQPGPEATAEQEAFVTSLLASLRDDDPPMPDHVAARLDAVLAEERRTTTFPLVAAADVDSDGLLDSADPAVATPAATVLPLAPSRDRARGRTRAFQVLGGVAAAVAAVVLVPTILHGTSSSQSTSASVASSGTGELRAAPATVQDSGTAYTRSALSAQATALLSRAKTLPAPAQVDSPVASPAATSNDTATGSGTTAGGYGTAATAAPSVGTPQSAAGPRLSDATLAACVESLAGKPGVTPLAADLATYDGKPAAIVVLPTDGDPGFLDVWVIAPVCTATSTDLFEFRRIPAPAGG